MRINENWRVSPVRFWPGPPSQPTRDGPPTGLGLRARTASGRTDEDAQRIDYAFRLCLARLPTDGERERLSEYLQSQLEQFASNEGTAEKLLEWEFVADASTLEKAAWTNFCSVLLNLHEFITLD